MPPKSVKLNNSLLPPDPSENLSPIGTFTVRPFPTPVSHKTFLRTSLHRASLTALGLKSGDLIQVANNGYEEDHWWPAIAWLAADPHLQRQAVLLSDNVRERVGVGFENKVLVRPYKGGVRDAGTVRVVQTEVGDEELSEGWQWFLEHILVETKYVFEGMVLPPVEYKGTRTTFRVNNISFTGEEPASGSAKENVVQVFQMVNTSNVEIPGMVGQPKNMDTIPATPKPATPPSTVTFASIGGLSSQINSLRTLLMSILQDSDKFSLRGLKAPRGVLLYGPSGTGKTMIMRAVASEINVTSFVLDGRVVGKYMGESEAAIRKIFNEAKNNQPAVIFMDEVDSLAPKRSLGEGSEGRVVTTILTEMDGIESIAQGGPAMRVAVVAATNRPNALDEALRRAGRLEHELEIGIPGADARRDILELLTNKIIFEPEPRVKEDILGSLAAKTHGYVGADLMAVVGGAFTIALNRWREKSADETANEEILMTERDLELSMKEVIPTAMREIFIEPPNVRWSEIGGQEGVKERLVEAVEWPLLRRETFERLGATPRKGLLLYGPPGCSKTLVAKALATESSLNFLAVKGPELFSMYVGESERAVREIFRKARAASPSIIFFDEIDALSQSREGKNSHGGANVLTALLNEMDGIQPLKNVFVLAATNRPEQIDPALLRPGRLDSILYVGPPDSKARIEIFRIRTSKMRIGGDVSIQDLALKTEGFSGAEVVNVCDEAVYCAMRESIDIDAVMARHFEKALNDVVPQISEDARKYYESWSVAGVKKV